MEYLALKVKLTPPKPWSEILISQLADYGFSGFEENSDGISAYGATDEIQLDEAFLETLLNGENPEVKIVVDKEVIAHQNWNAIWESEFQPVDVEGKLTILAPFHDQSDVKGIKIVIQPKMSFGTGHHQTTWMMSKLLMDLKSVPNNLLDMGTGTGILAFLAEKLGAKNILGIDIEPWSIESCEENITYNDSCEVKFLCGDIDLIEGMQFDMIIANINKNILKSQMAHYSKTLHKNGILLLSGFFESDVQELIDFAEPLNLSYNFHITKENWAAIQLSKN